METLLKQITTYDVHAPWSEQLQALADIKAVVEQVLQVDSRDAVVDSLTILSEPFKTDYWIESIRADVVHRARGFLNGLATTCGFALGQFVDDMMVSLVDAARSHIQKICQAGDDCMAVLASPSRYDVNKLIHTFDTVRGDDVRLLITNKLAFILKSWSQADLDPYVRDILSLLRDTRHETFNISQVKSCLSSEFGLGAGRTDSVVMPSLLFPPVSRRINKAVAKSWLNKGGMPMMMQSIAAAAPVVSGVDITAAYGLKAFLAHKFKKFWDITDNTNMLSAKLPGGFSASQLRAYMTQERFFGPKRIEIAMIHSLANAPVARFATEADAKTWINLVIDEYGSVSSAMIPFATKAGGAVSAGVPMMGGGGSISSAALDAFKAQMHTMMREQVKAYQAFMKFDPLATLKKTNADKVSRREKHNDLWVSEHGEYYEKGIQPKFDAKKIRIYSSYWNWVMQDALDLYYRTYANAQG
ncbi:hypothetical protein AeMF1_012772 [Aphanomyces euteiches]|nr:hypothetical protein AeMF1_012772 [Aphanomyces euteiches]